jgi:predicted transglutaminase-like cysteine proteinase
MAASWEKMLPPTTKLLFSSYDLRNTVPMPTAAATIQHLGRALLRAVVLLTGFFWLASLVAAAPDLDLMSQLAGQRFGIEGRRGISEWQQLLAEAGELPEEEQLQAVNEFVNSAVRFGNDAAIWGQPDYWATPLETLSRGQGDCEDFAIVKYVTLKLLGVPGKKLRLTYVKARTGGMYSQITQAHMVLSYYPTPTDLPLILDNLIADIMPASQRRDLHPIFSFSIEDLWVGTSPLPAASASARLSRWRDVLNRMRAEGLKVLFEPEKIEADQEVPKKEAQEKQEE